MGECSRRQWLAGLGLAAVGQGAIANAWQGEGRKRLPGGERMTGRGKLALEDYEPKSMLHVPETKVKRLPHSQS